LAEKSGVPAYNPIKRAEEQKTKQDRAEYVLKAKKILRTSSHWGATPASHSRSETGWIKAWCNATRGIAIQEQLINIFMKTKFTGITKHRS
jgi:hypothetical protein